MSDMSNTYEVPLTIGQRVRVTRERLGLEQAELAERLKTNRVRISDWERGVKVPDFEWSKRLAHVTGAPWWWLMGFDSVEEATTSTIWYRRLAWSGALCLLLPVGGRS